MNKEVRKEFDKFQLGVKIGERIKEIRKAQNISQAELARRCGKDKQHLELIENNKISANIFTLYTIVTALDMSLSEFFNEGFE